jgi:hypothetical protein
MEHTDQSSLNSSLGQSSAASSRRPPMALPVSSLGWRWSVRSCCSSPRRSLRRRRMNASLGAPRNSKRAGRTSAKTAGTSAGNAPKTVPSGTDGTTPPPVSAPQHCHPGHSGCVPADDDVSCAEIGDQHLQVRDVNVDLYNLDTVNKPGNGSDDRPPNPATSHPRSVPNELSVLKDDLVLAREV